MPSIQLKKRTAQFRGFSGSRRIALRALRSICLCSFLFTTGASPRAQLPSTLTLPNGTIASGHYWYGATTSITAGTSLTIDGSANVTVLAGSTIYLMPGFTAVAGSARTTFTAMVGTPPVLSITTASLPVGTAGASYGAVNLVATGGSGSYAWSATSLPSGLTLSAAGQLSGTPSSAGTFNAVFMATDAPAGVTSNLTSTPKTISITVNPGAPAPLSINGGSSNGQTLGGVTVPFAFSISDPNGANDVSYAQFRLVDSAGGTYCYGDWGRPSALDLYDGTGPTTSFGVNQYDSFCIVSLVSITNSPTNPDVVTVVLNFTFSPADLVSYGGSYTVSEQVNYLASGAGPWQNVGSLVIEPPPTLSPAPTVTLTDTTQTSGYYFVGDNFVLTVTGPTTPLSLPVSVSIGGVYYGVQGMLTNGTLSFPGNWTAASIGSYAETWYVDGVQAGQPVVFSVGTHYRRNLRNGAWPSTLTYAPANTHAATR